MGSVHFEDFFSTENVAKRAFWPFIHFTKKEIKYKVNKENSKKFGGYETKDREIFYASYFDGFIFSFYSFLISQKYEELLLKSNLYNVVLAYRRIKLEKSDGGKNNIHFAKEIFEEINKQQNCYVFAFDISSFFDNLNWNILEKNICTTLCVNELTDDWKNIFNAITKYSYIDQEDIKEYSLIKNRVINTEKFHKARKKYKKINKGEKLIKKTKFYSEKYGIAQGTPISGIMANLYMYDFDLYLNKYSKDKNGKYYRYSDDILVVVPYDKNNKKEIFNEVQKEVFHSINELKLKIQKKKTDIFEFDAGVLSNNFTYNENDKKFEEDKNIKLLQYLGFSFDGKNVLLRNKTLTRHYRRMIENIKRLSRLKPKKNKKGDIIRKSRIKGNKILLGNLNKRYSHSGAKKVNSRYGNFYGYVNASYNIMNNLNFDNIDNKVKAQMSKYGKNYDKVLIKKNLKGKKNN